MMHLLNDFLSVLTPWMLCMQQCLIYINKSCRGLCQRCYNMILASPAALTPVQRSCLFVPCMSQKNISACDRVRVDSWLLQAWLVETARPAVYVPSADDQCNANG